MAPLELGFLADGRPFVNVASAGLASVAARRADALKRALGPLAYGVGALRAALSERPVPVVVRVDGAEVFDGGCWQVIVAVTGRSAAARASPRPTRATAGSTSCRSRRLARRARPPRLGPAHADDRAPAGGRPRLRPRRGGLAARGTELNVDGELRSRRAGARDGAARGVLARGRLARGRGVLARLDASTRPPISIVPSGPGRTSMREPTPWRSVSGRPSAAPRRSAAAPVASSSAMPIATGKTRVRMRPASSSSQAHTWTWPASAPGCASTAAGGVELDPLELRRALGIGADPGRVALAPGRDLSRRRAQDVDAEQPAGADERMPGERQLDRRGEDAQLAARGVGDEHRLRVAEIRRDRLQLVVGEPVARPEDAEQVAAGAVVAGEDAEHLERGHGRCLSTERGTRPKPLPTQPQSPTRWRRTPISRRRRRRRAPGA